jgi:hypothetical protein
MFTSVGSMWQIVNLTNSVNPSLIDNQTLWFNFSAWMGGFRSQDDNAQVSLAFMDQNNQQVGNITTLGPVLAAQRLNITSLIFQQAGGLIPVSTRSFIVTVVVTRIEGTYNDGSIDNIVVAF